VKNPTTTTTPIVPDSSKISPTTTYPSSYMLKNASPHLPSFDVSKSSPICPPNESLRVPDPYDCSIYHDCYHGTDLISYCPGQLQYNPDKKTCDHPQNVQCREYLWIYKLTIFLHR
jgi:hypothetical protein